MENKVLIEKLKKFNTAKNHELFLKLNDKF
jgi:hypothetical protein